MGGDPLESAAWSAVADTDKKFHVDYERAALLESSPHAWGWTAGDLADGRSALTVVPTRMGGGPRWVITAAGIVAVVPRTRGGGPAGAYA